LAQFRRSRTPERRNDDGASRQKLKRGQSQPRSFYRNELSYARRANGDAGSVPSQVPPISQDDATTEGIPSIRSELSTSFSFFDKFRSKYQRRVMYHYFGDVPKEVLTVVEISHVPEPASPDHVVIKVAVSQLDRSMEL
jgi:hypothetical protein